MGKSSVILQALRGLAALGVVLCHLQPMLDQSGLAPKIFADGDLGVDVFFIISGFVIAVSTADPRSASPLAFVIRRAFRLLPLAWAALILMLLIIHADRALILRGFLLLPENPTLEHMPLNYPAWTLSYEVFFYILFATSLAISHKFRCEICLAMIAALSIVDLCLPTSDDAVRSFFQADLLLEFGAGLVLAKMIMSAPRDIGIVGPIAAGAAAIAAGIAICASRPLHGGFFAFGGGAALALAGVLLIETYVALAIPRWLHGLGEISYAIYISQAFVFIYVEATVFWAPVHGSWLWRHTAGGTRVALIVAVSLAISTLLHFAVERPGIRLGKRLAAGLRPRPVAPLEVGPVSG